MTVPTNVDVGDDTRDALAGLATSDQELLLEGLELRADWQARSGLDPRTFSLSRWPPWSRWTPLRPHTSGR